MACEDTASLFFGGCPLLVEEEGTSLEALELLLLLLFA